MANFRPVSNLSFMYKVVERAVANQLTEYLSANNLLPCFQSAYRKKQHSTETAILRVVSDMLMAADERQVTARNARLVSSIDIVDHTILLQRLRIGFCVTDVALQWVISFLTERTQQIAYNSKLSSLQAVWRTTGQRAMAVALRALHCRVVSYRRSPQTALHVYADDCQIYLSTPAKDAVTAVDRLSTCVTNINDWMTASRLHLNPTKTQIMWLGSSQQLDKIAIRSAAVVNPCNSRRYSSRPRRRSWPSAVVGRTCHCCLQEWLLSTEAATANHKIIVGGGS